MVHIMKVGASRRIFKKVLLVVTARLRAQRVRAAVALLHDQMVRIGAAGLVTQVCVVCVEVCKRGRAVRLSIFIIQVEV